MKLAGIDGVVVDWYGTVDHLDYAVNHRHTAVVPGTGGEDRARVRGLLRGPDDSRARRVRDGSTRASESSTLGRELRWLREQLVCQASLI